MKCQSISASRMKTWKECEMKYYLDYHLGLPQEKKWATENGTLCHEVYEKIALAKTKGKKSKMLRVWMDFLLHAYRKTRKVTGRYGDIEEIPPLWTLSPKALVREKDCEACPYFSENACWVTGKDVDKFDGCPKEEFEDSVWLIEKVLDDPDLNPHNRKVLAAEQVFQLKLDDGAGGEIKVNGVIDLVEEFDKDTIEITDYKTGKWIQSYSDCLLDPQLLIYYAAIRELYPQYKNIFITIHYIRRRVMSFTFNPEDDQMIRERIVKVYHEINDNEFPQRRCDRNNGLVKFDWVCSGICHPETCQREFEKMVKNGGIENEKEE